MDTKSIRLAALWVLGFACAHSAYAANPYPTNGSCDGLPKVNLKTPAGTCVGVVASDLKMPRGILPLADDVLLITEMGAWDKGRGRLSRLLWQNGRFERTTLIDNLDRPHGILLGADGWIYIGEASRIIRINPQALKDKPQIVIDKLPDGGHHPLKQMLFGDDGALYISMGAQTDHCENTNGANGSAPKYPCAEAQGARATGSVWKITSPLNRPQTSVYARGLRNAMGMTWSANGELVVTDNGRDAINQSNAKLSDAQLPHDEIDVVKQNADYGWPYCYDNNRVNPEYSKYPKACANKTAPAILLPAHSAPLGIIRYSTDGEISALRGQYIVALHGYRDTGHRLISIGTNAAGQPAGATTEIIGNWSAQGSQPMGAPTEVRAAPSGKLYITDDRNGVVLRLSNGR